MGLGMDTNNAVRKFRAAAGELEQAYAEAMGDREQLIEIVQRAAHVLAECQHAQPAVLKAMSSQCVEAIKKLNPAYYGLPVGGA